MSSVFPFAMSDTIYAPRLQAELLEPVRRAWDTTALPLTDFEWLNTALLVRQRQRTGQPKPLFVALPAYTDDLTTGLRAAVAAAWLAGHEPPTGHGSPALLKSGDYVFHDEETWLVTAPPSAAGQVSLKRVSDNRRRQTAATTCRKLLAPFDFAGLLDDNRAGYRYLQYQDWLKKLLTGTRQAQRTFRLLDKDALPRPHHGHTILLIPGEIRYNGFTETVLAQLAGAPVFWPRRTAAGSDHWNLPFAPSVHVVASLPEALELRRKKPGITTWHLSVVGKRAVGNSLRVAQLARAYQQGHWASLTFWGPDLGVGETPDCEVWPWSRTEARGPQVAPDAVRLTVAALPAPATGAADLPTLVAAIREVLLRLSQPTAPGVLPVRLPMIWNLLHRCLRYALPPGVASASSRDYLAELRQKVTDCLASEELDDAFFEARRRWPEREAAATELQAAFEQLLDYYHQHSPKYATLCHLLAEAREEGRPVLLASDRESLAATQAAWRGEPDVQVLPLLGTTDNVRRRLQERKLATDTLLLVPFLFNRDQLALLQTAPGPVHLVLLPEVEDGLYSRTLASQHQQEQQQLRASGRAAVLGKTYEQLTHAGTSTSSVPTPLRPTTDAAQLDYFAELYAVGDTRYASERQRSRASGQLYLLSFTDGSRAELDGNTRVLRQEPAATGSPEWVPTQTDQLQNGQQILFYENDQRQLIEQILRQHDRNGLVKRIDQASRVWQQALQQLAREYPTTARLYAALRVRGGLDVGQQTLQAYLDGRRRFPGDPSTLPALHRLAEHLDLLHCPLLAPGMMEEVKHCRTRFQQLTIALGKGLSEEVLRYRLTGTAGRLLSSLDADTRELVLLSAVERIVRDIRRK